MTPPEAGKAMIRLLRAAADLHAESCHGPNACTFVAGISAAIAEMVEVAHRDAGVILAREQDAQAELLSGIK